MVILPDHKYLQYSGRIDFDDPKAPVWVYPCTSVKMKFTGSSLKVRVENHHSCWNNFLGYFLDGRQGKVLLAESGEQVFDIPVMERKEVHEFILFKRQDSCHTITLYGFEVEEGSRLIKWEQKPGKRIEVYGDSVSAGEVSEAVEYVGKEDPEHQGEYSNSWYSYAWMTARKLGAEIHDIAQGGISLLNNTGWFAPPDYIGMEYVYDKISYNPYLGQEKYWDFTKYTPHVVIIAIGQNDSHPDDYMSREPDGERAHFWKAQYQKFVETIREKYPKAVIILTTTILGHAKEWDEAIGAVCDGLGDEKIVHFMYKRNGSGTPGHIRIPEAEEMSDELSTYIRSLGEDVWNDS